MKSIKKLSLLLVILALMVTMAACDSKKDVPANAPGPFDDQKIVVSGLLERDFEITQGDLKKLAAVTKHAESTRSNGEKVIVDATGPLLETFLKEYGKTQKDFSRIRFTAGDKYSIAVPQEILASRLVILSYVNDGRPLEDDYQPVRIVIPGERAMYWVKNLIRMDFETGADQKPPNKVVFLETAAKNLPQEDYQYYDSVDKAIKTQDLIAEYADINDTVVANVFMKAGDGLQKNETKANFLAAFIKVTGQDQPKFLAPQFPQGMHIRDLLYIIYGQTAIFDYTEGSACLPKQTFGDKEGIAFSQIFKQTGMAGGNKYKFTSADGKSIVLTNPELGEGGLIYQNAEGAVAFTCTGTSGKQNVEDLLSVEMLQ
ncbi:molybdopterin-dependent oxidoreductase [Pelotomaculum terephthalicicum JT]|uniref:molybdopterin-dependent oxidoreductase n=1 Tax=Pelotomaculum terephthalicicum TaxID=206393 RepID=UPI001F041806|nr:molybdopterin-dependent oxidoreductase [Pelotomaculum terephthalicicum]MCG9967280.1 molybdopterin-dependent oxidoreductase [Pelotomaculum terephthalicicum JT]